MGKGGEKSRDRRGRAQEGRRERNAWELNHVVGRLVREISRCESARAYTHIEITSERACIIRKRNTKAPAIRTANRT